MGDGIDDGAAVSAPWRPGPRLRWVLDVVPVGLLALAAVAAGLFAGELWWIVLGLVQTVPLVARRIRPATVYAIVAAASAVQALVVDIPLISQLGYPIALYNLARHRGPVAGALGLGVGLVAAVVASVAWVNGYAYDYVAAPRLSDFVPYSVTIGAVVTVSWAMGTLGRTRQAYVEALVESGERRVREAEQRILVAAGQERTRIAREMHDVVAHGLSVIVVQSDGARYAAERDPAVAVRTLETIGETGRAALTDMRLLLGLLRSGDEAGRAPQPGLADLPALVDLARRAGTPVSLRLPADLTLPDAMALTVFRVVQEALTNVRKHAAPEATVEVTVDVGRQVVVTIVDSGPRRTDAPPPGDTGLGLVGMTERVAVHGGELAAGPTPEGGWSVRARWSREQGTRGETR